MWYYCIYFFYFLLNIKPQNFYFDRNLYYQEWLMWKDHSASSALDYIFIWLIGSVSIIRLNYIAFLAIVRIKEINIKKLPTNWQVSYIHQHWFLLVFAAWRVFILGPVCVNCDLMQENPLKCLTVWESWFFLTGRGSLQR